MSQAVSKNGDDLLIDTTTACGDDDELVHSGKSVTIRESNHDSGVYKEHYV